jgi:hypothetical protein
MPRPSTRSRIGSITDPLGPRINVHGPCSRRAPAGPLVHRTDGSSIPPGVDHSASVEGRNIRRCRPSAQSMIPHPHASTEPPCRDKLLSASGFHPIAPCIGHVLVTVGDGLPGIAPAATRARRSGVQSHRQPNSRLRDPAGWLIMAKSSYAGNSAHRLRECCGHGYPDGVQSRRISQGELFSPWDVSLTAADPPTIPG